MKKKIITISVLILSLILLILIFFVSKNKGYNNFIKNTEIKNWELVYEKYKIALPYIGQPEILSIFIKPSSLQNIEDNIKYTEFLVSNYNLSSGLIDNMDYNRAIFNCTENKFTTLLEDYNLQQLDTKNINWTTIPNSDSDTINQNFQKSLNVVRDKICN